MTVTKKYFRKDKKIMRKLLAFLLVASMLATVALCAFAVSAETTNVALGKKYVTSPLHRQGGADVNWAYDENAEITYPDEGGVELTDGVIPVDLTYSDPGFMGFAAGTPETEAAGYAYMRVDLEETYDLTSLVLYVGTKALGAGLGVPDSVTFLKVDDMDGTNPVELGMVVPTESEDDACTPSKLDVNVAARYIEIRVARSWSWMFVAEFEAYATGVSSGSEPEPEPEVVIETIKVDGDLTDTGWVKASWNTYTLWQTPEAAKPEDRTAKTAIRTDADNIYIAFVIDGTIAPNIQDEYAGKVAGGLEANGAQTSTYTQTGATSFRLWLRTTDTERYLIDVQYLGEELGWVATRAIYPTGSTLTWDDLAGLIDIAVVYADGTVTAEFAIDKAAFGVEDDFRMFFSYWDNYEDLVDETNTSAYQVIHVCSENAQVSESGVIQYYSGNENLDAYISFTGADTKLDSYTVDPEPSTPDDTYEQEIADKVGDPLDDPDFAIDLSSSVEDGVLTVVLTLKDFKDGVAMQSFNAKLYYDTERLTLTNEINKDNSVKCETTLPYGDDSTWENLTRTKDGGLIDISFIVADEPDQVLDADHPIVLTFTFEVKEGVDKVGVYVPTESVKGSNVDNGKKYYGNGAYKVEPVKASPAPGPDDGSSKPDPEKPGDAGVLVFAILGILATAGAVTVIKVRH